MASIVVTRADLFPSGTKVKAYLAAGFHTGTSQSGAPSGKLAGEAEMTGSPPEATIEGVLAGTEYMLWAEVGGADKYLLQAAPPSAASTAVTGVWTPPANKLLGASFDPVAASGSKILTTAGTLHTAKVFVPEPCKVSNILLYILTKGGTLTAAENGAGLFAEATRALLSFVKPSTLITAWEEENKLLTLALEAPQVLPAGFVTFGAYFKGTTAPTFAAAASGAQVAALANAGVSTTSSRFATGDTGLTTALPNPITSSMVASVDAIWVGLS